MFRVGFGDFFLLTVPHKDGKKHILIDCGVHAKDLGTIRSAVEQMADDCGRHLSLVIMTHRHADHISGFASCSDIFSEITVDAVWMPWFENPTNKIASAFQASLTATANQLAMRLNARGNAEAEHLRMLENITGVPDPVQGFSSNQKALDVLHNGFKNKVKPQYYKSGDQPSLPAELTAAGLSAQIIGPPIDPVLIAQMTNKAQQYLSDLTVEDDASLKPFADAFRAIETQYPDEAFEFYSADQVRQQIHDAQPLALAARAAAADKTLNNQSLVIVFSMAGRNLLFAGDAQWGNWEHFLYGGAFGTPGHTEITGQAKAILSSIDFYKVGHHGSANATPKDAVKAMRLGCCGMCSTQIDAYNEVPREPLLAALSERMNGQIARSDQVAANASLGPNTAAGPLPAAFTAPTGVLFVDFEL
ncbi:putative Metallo-hydrolase [Mesorhizobium plurifarium]|uniref:Putative Metallo-hydrolase n=1 Tax=Mesorhizobium plurifarium TaxID=69974 RepID=A0A090DTM6_MESPL|nr:putative Metallo-hydrolase [Mesorhizobium plurifarium]